MEESVTNRLALMGSESPVKLTETLMCQYRESLISRGCRKQTVQLYSCCIRKLSVFLQGEKELTEENLKEWLRYLQEMGYSIRTINLHISSVNGLLRYCGKGKMPAVTLSVSQNTRLPEFTREGYLQVLSYAKKHCSSRDYLLIKTLATIDISVSSLCYMTVEACERGALGSGNSKETVIPRSLQQELLAYIEEKKLKTGSVFISNRGNQLDRSNITHRIEMIAVAAGLEPGECTPRSLHHLYERTQEGITQHLMTLHRQIYEELLDEEKKIS